MPLIKPWDAPAFASPPPARRREGRAASARRVTEPRSLTPLGAASGLSPLSFPLNLDGGGLFLGSTGSWIVWERSWEGGEVLHWIAVLARAREGGGMESDSSQRKEEELVSSSRGRAAKSTWLRWIFAPY